MTRVGGARATALAVAVAVFAAQGANARLPSIVFILLDTTRADRMSAWGHSRHTTPNLDRLASRGIRFARHFANSHATRPSMPQLMSGRYYLSNILRPFRSRRHPHDYPFAIPPSPLVLLPTVLRNAGYHLAAVSAHPWVVGNSLFGTAFDTFDFLDAPAARGHATAAAVVDRGLARWRTRPTDRPTFLYLHFMDMHMPRHVPIDALRFGAATAATHARFDEYGEPRFGRRRRGWDRSDASDFTAADRQYFLDVYDTTLAILDEQIGRLLEAITQDDPDLRNTLIVVIADHGEELGELGRTSHEDSLADAVQHVPWILTGAGLSPGQRAAGVSEHVDVLPTITNLLGLPRPVDVDGRAMLENGRICRSCLRSAPVYAWEDYQAIRMGGRLLRLNPPQTFAAICRGESVLMDEDRATELERPDKIRRGRAWVERRLATRETAFRRSRYGAPSGPFFAPVSFWRIEGQPTLFCLEVGPDTPRAAFDRPGWIWTGRGLVVMRADAAPPPLELTLEVPDGRYAVTVSSWPALPPPRLFGYARWLRRAFRRRTGTERHGLGRGEARDGRLRISLPPAVALNRHVVEIELSPLDPPRDPSRPAAAPAARQWQQLRRLGYVD